MSAETTVYYLEMHEPPNGNSHPLPEGFQVLKISPPDPQTNARFYREVGGPWAWRDQLVWSHEDWAKVVDRPEFHTWVATLHGDAVGYFEIEQQQEGDAEIVHFGLVEAFVGRGFGRAMLNETIRLAWKLPGTRRVWLHTCTKDHPGALENYRRHFCYFKCLKRPGARDCCHFFYFRCLKAPEHETVGFSANSDAQKGPGARDCSHFCSFECSKRPWSTRLLAFLII